MQNLRKIKLHGYHYHLRPQPNAPDFVGTTSGKEFKHQHHIQLEA